MYIFTAILVRIRSGAVVDGSQTSHVIKVRKLFKTNKPIKKKPEIRFNNGGCNCRTNLFMEKDYLVFGKHVPWNGTIEILEVNRDSFVTEWEDTLEKEMEQLKGHCLQSATIPTPPMSPTATFITSTSLQFMEKDTIIGMLSVKENFN